jgi:acyl-CoA reductase-like NAD-dependent aldehyde dehydrogenase
MPITAVHGQFIGGESLRSDRTFQVRLPYDGSVVAEVCEGDVDSLNTAIDAAQRAAPQMRNLGNPARSDLLLAVRTLLLRDAAELARTICLETGKPIKEARFEVDRATQTLMAAAIAARELTGITVPMEGRMAMTVRDPLGVIGAITPWNVPLNLALHKVASAIASGNTVVHKPSEITPVSALRLAELFAEAGCPRGAYNVVTGDGASLGQALVRDSRVRMITFTGSVEVGREIRANAGLKRVTLELGGNSPVIIERDADLELATARCLQGAFANSGQLCISVQRIFAHEEIASAFLENFTAAAGRLTIGHPLEETTEISSLVSEAEAVRVEEWIADAVSKGAKRLVGGERRRATLTPCVLEELPTTARMSCQEVFGPVVAVNRYSKLDDAISQANSTPYGLQAGIFTRNLEMAFDAARRLEAGGVMINEVPTFRADHMPYGGMKDSGLGREGPRYAVEEMTEVKLICWR